MKIFSQVELDEDDIVAIQKRAQAPHATTNGLGRGSYPTNPPKKQPKTFLLFLCCCCLPGFKKKGVKSKDDLNNELVATSSFPNNGTTNGTVLPSNVPLLPLGQKKGKICLVLDLDETLVHSSFKPVPEADFVIPVEIENIVHKVYVLKRPGVDEFLKRCGDLFEVVVFTASLAKYADPVLDLLDPQKVVDFRLFREACSVHKGNYVKDLNRIGRKVKRTLIIDNSPHSYCFHPENAIPVESWFEDKNDRELLELMPFLEEASRCEDVIKFLKDKGLTNGLAT